MKNIEIKYRLAKRSEISQFLQTLTEVQFIKTIQQTDIYYQVSRGRLKLRIESPDNARLIYYERENLSTARQSDYLLFPVPRPEHLNDLLTQALGEKITVRKERSLFMYRNVRIHLDRVKQLGDFLEFESIINDETPAEQAAQNLQNIQEILAHFEMVPLSGSYADLLRDKTV